MRAAPPPLPVGSLYYEVVEARLKEGLHFRGGGQTLRFGDSPQVRAARRATQSKNLFRVVSDPLRFGDQGLGFGVLSPTEPLHALLLAHE